MNPMKTTKSPKKQDLLLEAPKKKKKVEVIEVTPKKKKKKKTTEIAVAEPQKISKLGKKAKLKTIFGNQSEKILQMLEREDTDPAVALIYKHLLQTLVDTMPLAELGVRASKGTRGVYQLNQMVSSIRELMVDIMAAQDRGMMGEALLEQVIKPSFSDIAQDVVLEYSTVAADAKALMTADQYEKFLPLVRESRARLANSMTRHYGVLKEGTIGYLQR